MNILISGYIYSQNSFEPGLRSSLNWSKSNVKYTTAFANDDTVKENRMLSIGKGVFLKYNTGKYFSFEGQFDWVDKGYQKTFETPPRKDTASQKYIFRDQFEFIDIKMKFYYNIYPDERFRISPSAGIGLSWLIEEKQTYKYLPTDSLRYLQKTIFGGKSFFNLFRKYNFLAEFGVSATYKVSKNVNLFIETFYNLQLNNLIKSPSSNRTEYINLKPNIYGISAGLSFIIDYEPEIKEKNY